MKIKLLLISLVFIGALSAQSEQDRRDEEFRTICYKIAAVNIATSFVASIAGSMIAYGIIHEIKTRNKG